MRRDDIATHTCKIQATDFSQCSQPIQLIRKKNSLCVVHAGHGCVATLHSSLRWLCFAWWWWWSLLLKLCWDLSISALSNVIPPGVSCFSVLQLPGFSFGTRQQSEIQSSKPSPAARTSLSSASQPLVSFRLSQSQEAGGAEAYYICRPSELLCRGNKHHRYLAGRLLI